MQAFDKIRRAAEEYSRRLLVKEVGYVSTVMNGIVTVKGLPGVGYNEVVRFPGDIAGIAFNLEEEDVGVIILGAYQEIHAGDEVYRTGRVMDVPAGAALAGRIIDPMGMPLDDKGPIDHSVRLPIERPSPGIMDRAPVSVPLQTGIKVIDALVPIGRGQRELILGDRQTGKTAVAIDAILNQRDQDVICIYCAIGQHAAGVAKLVAELEKGGAMAHTIVMVTTGNDPPGLKYVAPYAATSIAEYFMESGQDVLIVYDDLTQHAQAYREISLLNRRPPGREAFPGDIFYIHSRLLERATHLRPEKGGGSLTALPIVETEAQNISDYIPTNLISITDGQLYLSPVLFALDILPAIDVGRSVSRVGGKAQRPAFRQMAGDLKLRYAQFAELENFTRFGARIDEGTRRVLAHGERIRAVLKQPEGQPIPAPEQIMVLAALGGQLFDEVPLASMARAEAAVRASFSMLPANLCSQLVGPAELSGENISAIKATAASAIQPYKTSAQ